jgi:F0F1-type ATP synthase delta subunit
MLSRKRVTVLAKRLAKLSLDGAEIDLSRVHAIAQLITEFAEIVRHSLQRKYLHFLENECHRVRLSIEYVDECDFIQIQSLVEQHVRRKLKLEMMENKALIAGLKITVGDYIWERSIRGDLSMLCA